MKNKLLRSLAVVIAAALVINLFCLIPGGKVQAGTYGDLSGYAEDSFGNVVVDNGAGNLIDRGSNILINTGGVPQNIITHTPLAGNAGVIVNSNPNPAYHWYNNPRFAQAGRIIKVGGFFIGSYDTVKDTYKFWNYSSPEHYSETEAAIDHGLFAVDVGMGMWAVVKGGVVFVGAVAAGATVGPALVTAAGATAGIYAVTRLGVQGTRALYNGGYFGYARDGLYNGWNYVSTGAANKYNSFISWGGRQVGWLENALMGMAMGGIEDDFPFEGMDNFNDEIPDSRTGIGVYKPNIYLYYDRDTLVNVKLSREELITASIPEYPSGEGWTTCVRDGSINAVEDYLFYEAIVPDSGFNKQTGWLVKADSLDSDMSFILGLYGFNEKEKADFLEYWSPALAGKGDFVFYPQETSVVQRIMPVLATPVPENIYRIWFYIEAFNGFQPMAPVNVERILSRHDALVEWGGIYRPD